MAGSQQLAISRSGPRLIPFDSEIVYMEYTTSKKIDSDFPCLWEILGLERRER
jgi:hypothetical protein